MDTRDDMILTDEQIEELSAEQRLRLIERLWDGMEGGESLPDLPEALLDDLEAEVQAHVRYPDSSRPWAEVYARLKSRLG